MSKNSKLASDFKKSLVGQTLKLAPGMGSAFDNAHSGIGAMNGNLKFTVVEDTRFDQEERDKRFVVASELYDEDNPVLKKHKFRTEPDLFQLAR